MKIIGISAKMQGGKTTLAEGLKRKLEASGMFPESPTVAEVCFADRLKQLVASYFIEPDTKAVFDKNSLKDDAVKQKVHSCGLTYRQILQQIGTDVGRKMWPAIWLENYAWDIMSMYPHYDYILTPDVRFLNEARYIKSMGGIVVRLTRSPIPSTHESETALDNYKEFDLVVDNREHTIQQTVDYVYDWLVSKEYAI